MYEDEAVDPEDLLGFDGESEFDDKPVVRGDRFDLEQFVDPRKMITWMNRTRRLPLEAIDDAIVNKTYSAAVWLFRSAAVSGQINAAKAMKLWLDWAQPVINKSKRDRKKPEESKGSVAFLPRNPQPGDEVEE